jgi:glycosyltransferase involved in cell wall biosynthesis
MAASIGAVPICGNVPGIEKYVRDSVNGFVFQQEETRSIAELILTLKNHPSLCEELGVRFQRDTLKNFSSDKISDQLLSIFKGNIYQTQNYSRQAL